MGVRGIDELVTVLPPAAAEPARAVAQGLTDLASLRHSALAPDEVRALGEVWERFTAQVVSGRLGVLAAIDARDDVIPKARVGDAGAVFAQHVLGQRRGSARRDGVWAGLLRPEVGDLPAVGAAFAAGDVSGAHVEVAVRAHRDLGARVRETLMDCQAPDADTDTDTDTDTDGDTDGVGVGDRAEGTGDVLTGQLRAALESLSDAFTTRVRLIRVVDVVLAHYARRFTVPELEAIATRIVRTLNPPDPKGAHERRFLHMSQLPDGTWRARFECGPEQGLRIKRALAAFSAPRPGTAIDADGVEHAIPDTRDLGARQIDAVSDIIAIALAKTGITLPTDTHTARPGRPTCPTLPNPAGQSVPPSDIDEGDADAGAGDAAGDDAAAGYDATAGDDQGAFWPAPGPEDEDADGDQPLTEPPRGEGETVVLRQPGALMAPYPSADIVVVAGIEHVATAWAQQPDGLPLDLDNAFNAWLRDRLRTRTQSSQEPVNNKPAGEEPARERAGDERLSPEQPPPQDQRTDEPRTDEPRTDEPRTDEPRTDEPAADKQSGDDQPAEEPPGEVSGESPRAGGGINRDKHDRRRELCEPPRLDDLGWLGRALSPYGIPARMEHAGLVDAATLELLACNATIRAALLAPGGALLDLGRTQRLASPAQKTALLARDGGCVIPGCTVPGDACDAHHVQWWTRGGPTDLDNLALACGRHHTEVHQETWEIQIRDGIPWVTPPSWIDRTRRPLRNAAHHPA